MSNHRICNDCSKSLQTCTHSRDQTQQQPTRRLHSLSGGLSLARMPTKCLLAHSNSNSRGCPSVARAVWSFCAKAALYCCRTMHCITCPSYSFLSAKHRARRSTQRSAALSCSLTRTNRAIERLDCSSQTCKPSTHSI